MKYPAGRRAVGLGRVRKGVRIAGRLGVATQLCFLRHPGRAWSSEEIMPAAMLRFIALQVAADPADLASYAERDQTRREHAAEVMREYGFTAFGVKEYRRYRPG